MTTEQRLNIKFKNELEILTIQINHYYALSKMNKIEDAEKQLAYFEGMRTMLENILMQYYTNKNGFYIEWLYDRKYQIVKKSRR